MREHTYDWIKKQVEEIAAERCVQNDRAFAVWCLQYAHKELDVDEAFVKTDTLKGSGGGDEGLDGWYRDKEDREFHLWQCKWSESSEKIFGKKPAVELKNALEELLDVERAQQYGDKFVKVSSQLIRSLSLSYRIILNVGIAGSMNDSAKAQFNKTIEGFANDKSIEVDWELWDLSKCQQEYEEHHPSDETLKGESFKFKLQSSELIKMGADDLTLPKKWEVVVASLNGKCLGQLAAELGSKLFGLNVRFALGSNKRIKSIWKSLTDEEDSQYFWLYNNGLTILCDDFKVNYDKQNKPETITINNPQIVNGCQTVTAFQKQLGKYSDAPSVLARIIKPPSDKDGEEKALLVAEKTNSQNPVLSRDLRSNDSVQNKLRKAFEQIEPPWFYERKRGEWRTLSKPEQDRFKDENPIVKGSYRKLDMEYVGQAWRMLMGEPSKAILRKKQLFEDDDLYSKVFHPNRNPEQLLFAALLRARYESFWHGNNFDGIRNACDAHGDYLNDSTLRRMIHAKGQVVAHSVALTCRALQKGDRWQLEDARLGLELIYDFDERLKRWNKFLAKAFDDQLKTIDKDEESPGLKRTLEGSDGSALEELWKSIQTFSSFIEESSPRGILVKGINM